MNQNFILKNKTRFEEFEFPRGILSFSSPFGIGSLIPLSLLAIFTSLMATNDSSSVDMGSAIDSTHDDDDFFTSSAATRCAEGMSICVLTHSFSLSVLNTDACSLCSQHCTEWISYAN